MASPRSMLTSGFLLFSLASRAYADTCALTAANIGTSGVDLGGSSTNSFSGFFLQINGGEKITVEADSGNQFPLNYPCNNDDIAQSTFAIFPDTPKGRLGMCITDPTGIVPGRIYNCKDQGGKKFEGTKDGSFYGLGVALGTYCTITFDC